MKAALVLWTALVLYGSPVQVAGQDKPWFTDDQARDIAGSAIHSQDPEPCYNTYRDERLESFVLSVRTNPIAGKHINNSVYFYRVASDYCEYVVEESGKQFLRTQVTMDCCEYGIVAVDRVTGKSFWFGGSRKRSDTFREFAADEQLSPDFKEPILFTALYQELVWGPDKGKDIQSLWQLRDFVQSNFRSAYSPYERDTRWERKFEAWWRHFRSQTPNLTLKTTFETTSDGTMVRGYGFSGFELAVPRSDPPPKGTPKLLQWALLVRPDGTIEEQSVKVIYSHR